LFWASTVALAEKFITIFDMPYPSPNHARERKAMSQSTKTPLALLVPLLAGLCATIGCTEEQPPGPDTGGATIEDTTDDAQTEDADTGDADVKGADAGLEEIEPGVHARAIHKFPAYELDAGEEIIPCVQWTLDNEEPIYVNSVTLANNGGFHHSNWFVTPEEYASGEDGYFNCDDRGFHELTAALNGTVLFAQSTQAQKEVQKFPEGAAIKIPPNSKIIAGVHFLNIAAHTRKAKARMTLGLTHPREVDTVLTPFRLTYFPLDIPPESEARFTGECNFADPYEAQSGEDYAPNLYYVLPHYHGLGNYFGLELFGGERDGEQVFELEGFNAEANGQTFDPPLNLADSKGFRFTCGYDNPRDESVGWGVGSQEMCVMLGFTDADLMVDAPVEGQNQVIREEEGIVYNTGQCNVQPYPTGKSGEMPSSAERERPMYVPESDTDEDIDPVPDCEDTPASAEPLKEPTLTNLKRDIFSVSCAFSSCHGEESAAANLNLTGDNLRQRLVDHQMVTPTQMPLVDPGNPDGSWLYEVVSKCEPESDAGPVSHMPRNSPTLLDPELVAMVREWIAQGAKDN
jgi:hypothetical protein